DRRLGSPATAESAERATTRRSSGQRGRTARSCGSGPGRGADAGRARTGTASARGTATTTAEAARTAGTADIQATDVTLAQRGVPGRLDPAGLVRGDAVVLAVIQQDVGV